MITIKYDDSATIGTLILTDKLDAIYDVRIEGGTSFWLGTWTTPVCGFGYILRQTLAIQPKKKGTAVCASCGP